MVAWNRIAAADALAVAGDEVAKHERTAAAPVDERVEAVRLDAEALREVHGERVGLFGVHRPELDDDRRGDRRQLGARGHHNPARGVRSARELVDQRRDGRRREMRVVDHQHVALAREHVDELAQVSRAVAGQAREQVRRQHLGDVRIDNHPGHRDVRPSGPRHEVAGRVIRELALADAGEPVDERYRLSVQRLEPLLLDDPAEEKPTHIESLPSLFRARGRHDVHVQTMYI